MGQDSRPNSSDLVIIEDVVSGPGLGNCFRFLTHQDATPTALDSLGDEELPAAVASRALGGDEAGAAGGAEEERLRSVCKEALRLWLGCFVGELRAASLRFLPTGGLFLALKCYLRTVQSSRRSYTQKSALSTTHWTTS